MNPFDFAIIIILMSMVKTTIHRYMEYRLRMADRLGGSGDRSVVRALEELRAEMAALRRHETDAILSFDSTLQTLDARLKNIERRMLSEGPTDHVPLGSAGYPREEPARVEVRGGASYGP